jgi:hypothetical protein
MIARVEGRLDVRGTVRVPRCCVEVNHAIERATAANPFVDRLALLLLVRVVVTLERGALERVLERRQRGADDAHPVQMSTCDELFVAVNDVLRRRRLLVWSQDTVGPADVVVGAPRVRATAGPGTCWNRCGARVTGKRVGTVNDDSTSLPIKLSESNLSA